MTERDGSKIWTCQKPMTAFEKPKEIRCDVYGAQGYIAQPKIDGIRITFRVRSGGLMAWTRPGPGRPDGKVRQLPRPVADAACALPDGVYDSEMAPVSGTSADVAKKDKNGDLKLFLFDILETIDGQPTVQLRLSDRLAVLAIAYQAVQDTDHVRLVQAVPCTDAQYHAILDAGGEGLMLKHPDSVYRPGARTRSWLKVKPTEHDTMTIIGYEPAVRGPYATMRLLDAEGHTLTVSTQNWLIAAIEKNPNAFLGSPLVIKYTQRTNTCKLHGADCQGSYRHPRMHAEKTQALWKKERL